MAKKSIKMRTSIIASITTPLAFFTLGILVIEGILASLSIRAAGTNLTILIIGMLIGFALLCSMVFFLAVSPSRRHLLLGTSPDQSPVAQINSMQLTDNDIRVLYCGVGPHSPSSEQIVGDTHLSQEMRMRKFKKLKFVEWDRGLGYILTPEGNEFRLLLITFVRAIREMKKV